MRLAVTGAAGFIGSHLSDALLAAGHEVVGIDLLTADYERDRKLANLSSALEHPAFSFHAEDVRLPDCRQHLRGCRAVLHLAGLGGARGTDVAALTAANPATAQAIVEHAAAAGVTRVLLASSSSVYGERSDVPGEDPALKPVSPYAHSKLLSETVAGERASALGIELVVARLFSVYGPRQRPDMAFARYIESAYTGESMPRFLGGVQQRMFTFVEDAVRGISLALTRGAPGSVHDIAGPERVSLSEALDELGRLMLPLETALEDCDSPVREPRSVRADVASTHSELGFRATVKLQEGLRRQVAASQRTSARLVAVGCAAS